MKIWYQKDMIRLQLFRYCLKSPLKTLHGRFHLKGRETHDALSFCTHSSHRFSVTVCGIRLHLINCESEKKVNLCEVIVQCHVLSLYLG